jgi:tRNA dimethylallyltransferase
MDEIRGAEKTMRKTYSYTLTESQRLRNNEVRYLRKSYSKPKIIVVVGPTASGKSDLAVVLAKQFGGEVVSADSRQVYRDMDIGTGKVTKREMAGIPHHLLDVVSPKTIYSVADYQHDGAEAIREILGRGKLPIICGGTGFYISALVDNLILPDVPPDQKLRKHLEKKSPRELFALLKKLDPKRAKTIDEKNPRRLLRAIEIATALGSVPPLKHGGQYDPLMIGIITPTQKLRERIRLRLLARMRSGMAAEVRRLHQKGLSWKRMENLGLEYRYLARYLQGKLTKPEMLMQLEAEIAHYAKRQMTWFNKDKRIHWVPREERGAIRLVTQFLKQ